MHERNDFTSPENFVPLERHLLCKHQKKKKKEEKRKKKRRITRKTRKPKEKERDNDRVRKGVDTWGKREKEEEKGEENMYMYVCAPERWLKVVLRRGGRGGARAEERKYSLPPCAHPPFARGRRYESTIT